MKKITKTLATLGVVGGLLFSSVGDASAANVHYKDVKKTSNYYSAVESLLEQEAISGTLPNFRPNENITRGQAASILVKVLGLDINNIKDRDFKDVPKSHQFYPYVTALANERIIGGKSDGTFGINEPLTRGQMSAILLNAFDIPLVGIYDVELEKFKDLYESRINTVEKSEVWKTNKLKEYKFTHQFSQHAYTMNYFGFASGYPTEERFGINEPIKRSQFALMIKKLQENEGKLAFFPIEYERFGVLNTFFDATKNGAIKKINKFTVEDESIISVNTYLTYNWHKSRLDWKYYLNLTFGYTETQVSNGYIVFNLHKEGKTKVTPPYLRTNFVVKVTEVDGKLVATYEYEPKSIEEPTTSEDTATVTTDTSNVTE